jgi:protein TonB
MTHKSPTSVEWLSPDVAKEFGVAWAMLQPPRAIPIPPQPTPQCGPQAPLQVIAAWFQSARTMAPQQLPTATARASPASLSVADWKSQIIELLNRNKRYPATAPRDEERIVKVYFSLDRSGRVMDSHIISSSGSSAVDEEALALMRRSEPFPATSQELKDRVKDAADPFRSTISITKAPTPIRPGPVSTK